jgi:hypothetical protein
MPFKSWLTLAVGLALAACHEQARDAATGAPSATPVAAAPQPTPSASASTPTISLAEGSTTVTVTPAPTPCGAEKLLDYVNLIPTSTAKEEIARTLGHARVRYVPLHTPTSASEPDRVTAEVGVDGRIKKFVCG